MRLLQPYYAGLTRPGRNRCPHRTGQVPPRRVTVGNTTAHRAEPQHAVIRSVRRGRERSSSVLATVRTPVRSSDLLER